MRLMVRYGRLSPTVLQPLTPPDFSSNNTIDTNKTTHTFHTATTTVGLGRAFPLVFFFRDRIRLRCMEQAWYLR